jgi:hypothetical protein
LIVLAFVSLGIAVVAFFFARGTMSYVLRRADAVQPFAAEHPLRILMAGLDRAAHVELWLAVLLGVAALAALAGRKMARLTLELVYWFQLAAVIFAVAWLDGLFVAVESSVADDKRPMAGAAHMILVVAGIVAVIFTAILIRFLRSRSVREAAI